MVKYKAPLREYEFILREVLDIEKELGSYPEYSEATWDMIEMVSEQFAKINEDYWLPSAKEGDEVGVKFDNGNVIVPDSMKEATKIIKQLEDQIKRLKEKIDTMNREHASNK